MQKEVTYIIDKKNGIFVVCMKMKKKIIISSENLVLYYTMMKSFGKEYDIIRYQNIWCLGETDTAEMVLGKSAGMIIENAVHFKKNLEMIRNLRLGKYTGFILFVSGTEDRQMQIMEKVASVDAGVDEYLRYPQTDEEIIASVKALLRRFGCEKAYNLTINGEQFLINPQTRKVFWDGEEIIFTKTEFAIWNYLLQHLNRAVSHKELYEAVWKREYIHDNTNIMAHIHRIRKKMGDDTQNPLYIQNVHGTGYIVNAKW